MSAGSGFYLLYLAAGRPLFETTAFCCTGAAILCSLIAMMTGLFTWWLNYMARPVRQVTIKIILSCIMLVDAIAVFVWRLTEPDILHQSAGAAALYLILVLALGPLAIIIGYFGGTLTFPLEKK